MQLNAKHNYHAQLIIINAALFKRIFQIENSIAKHLHSPQISAIIGKEPISAERKCENELYQASDGRYFPVTEQPVPNDSYHRTSSSRQDDDAEKTHGRGKYRTFIYYAR